MPTEESMGRCAEELLVPIGKTTALDMWSPAEHHSTADCGKPTLSSPHRVSEQGSTRGSGGC